MDVDIEQDLQEEAANRALLQEEAEERPENPSWACQECGYWDYRLTEYPSSAEYRCGRCGHLEVEEY